jgi:hypothetical protein
MGQDSGQHIERPNVVKARLGQSALDCFRHIPKWTKRLCMTLPLPSALTPDRVAQSQLL